MKAIANHPEGNLLLKKRTHKIFITSLCLNIPFLATSADDWSINSYCIKSLFVLCTSFTFHIMYLFHLKTVHSIMFWNFILIFLILNKRTFFGVEGTSVSFCKFRCTITLKKLSLNINISLLAYRFKFYWISVSFLQWIAYFSLTLWKEASLLFKNISSILSYMVSHRDILPVS